MRVCVRLVVGCGGQWWDVSGTLGATVVTGGPGGQLWGCGFRRFNAGVGG